jgi:hypothetical protein
MIGNDLMNGMGGAGARRLVTKDSIDFARPGRSGREFMQLVHPSF